MFDTITEEAKKKAIIEINNEINEKNRNKEILEKILPVLKKFDGKPLTKRIDTALKALNLTYQEKHLVIYAHEEYSSFTISFWVDYSDRCTLYVEKKNENEKIVFDYKTSVDKWQRVINPEDAISNLQNMLDNIDSLVIDYNRAINKLNEINEKIGYPLSNYVTVGYKR